MTIRNTDMLDQLDPKDVRIDIYTNARPGMTITLVHMPTGLSVKNYGFSQVLLIRSLTVELLGKVNAQK